MAFNETRLTRGPDLPTREGLEITKDGTHIRRGRNSVTVDFEPGPRMTSRDGSKGHHQNLAATMEESELRDIAMRVVESAKADEASRQDWWRRMDQAVTLLGIKNKPEEELLFKGASSIQHPLIAEAVVQFQSRAIEELYPAEGPVKAMVVGEKTDEAEDQAERVQAHMNYQVTEEDPSWFWHLDQMLFYLPLCGSAFKKTFYCPVSDRVISRFVAAEHILIPYNAKDIATASRWTHVQHMTYEMIKKLQRRGFYRTVPLDKSYADSAGEDETRRVIDLADSREHSVDQDDTDHPIYEQVRDLQLKGDKEPRPYIVTVEVTNEIVLAIRRGWRENDELYQRRNWLTHYRYLPGLGVYGFGLLHLIGSLAEGASATMQSMLDSGAFSSMQGGFATKDAKMSGDHQMIPGVFHPTDLTPDEIKNAFFVPPFKPPTEAMFKLHAALVEAGQRFSSTTESMVGDASNTGPVGTTLALIEQGSKIFSAIHKRLHISQRDEFRLRAELNYDFLEETVHFAAVGEALEVRREDYSDAVDVVPVSDPNVFSSTQRIAIAQATLELAEGAPDLYDRRKVHERFLRALRVRDPDELLKGDEFYRLDPATENTFALVGRPIKAWAEEHHEAHLIVHQQFLESMSGSEEAMAALGPLMMAHLAEHYALLYRQQVEQAMGVQLPAMDPTDQNADVQEMPPEVLAEIAAATAQAVQGMPPLIPQEEGEDPAEAEEGRKDMLAQREADRKDAMAEREQARKDSEHQRELQRKEAQFAQALNQAEDKHIADLVALHEKTKNEEARKDIANMLELARQAKAEKAKPAN